MAPDTTEGVQAHVFEVDIDLVHENPANPRVIKDAALKKLVKSLREFPEMLWKRPPVVITEGNGYMALGGNKRTVAAKAAGYKRIPVMLADDWDPDQRKRFIVIDNEQAGDWDLKMLKEQYSLDFIMETTSISIPSAILRGDDSLQDEFESPPIEQVKTTIVPGTLITIGPHRLVCGDSGDPGAVDRLMDGREADLILTDPPYGVEYVGKTKQKHRVVNDGKNTLPGIIAAGFGSYMRIARAGCPAYVFGPSGPNQRVFWEEITSAGFQIRQGLVWVKDAAVLGHCDYHYRHESIILAYKPGVQGRLGRGGDRWSGGNTQDSVFEFPRPKRNADHATEKPVDLFAIFIRNHSHREDLVVDLFVGGGTTMVAAHKLGRVAYCMDIDARCCQVVLDRMKALDPSLEVKVHGPGRG